MPKKKNMKGGLQMLRRGVYWVISILFALIAFLLVYSPLRPLIEDNQPQFLPVYLVAAPIVFGIIGLFIAGPLMRLLEKFTEKLVSYISQISFGDMIGGLFGLIAGLIIASLLGSAFGRIEIIGPYLAVICVLFFGYIGLLVGYRKKDDVKNFLSRGETSREKADKKDRDKSGKITPKILDTSVIIDGRIADIYRTGFIEGELVISNFVLEELRHIADSSDPLKRNRGRGGLDTLNLLRETFGSRIIITDKDYPDTIEVDSKLLRLAQDMKGVVITNDFNLNKVAQLQNVRVLNINELSNAVKPIVLPGEEMITQVVKDGKEAGQGVAYLDDGTMIVIENGKKYLNKTFYVVVTSILQTAAGRMVFAKPKYDKDGNIIEPSDGAPMGQSEQWAVGSGQ